MTEKEQRLVVVLKDGMGVCGRIRDTKDDTTREWHINRLLKILDYVSTELASGDV